MPTFDDALASLGLWQSRLIATYTKFQELGSSPSGSAHKSLAQSSDAHTPPWIRKHNPKDDLSKPKETPLKTCDPNVHKSDLTLKGSSPSDSANKSLAQSSNVHTPPWIRKHNPEDYLSRPKGKPLKTCDPNVHKLDLTPKDSHLNTKSENPVLFSSSSRVVPPSRKRKADDELPNPSKKPVSTRKEGGPTAGSASNDRKVAENPQKSEASSAMSSAQKNTANAGTASKDLILSQNPEKSRPSSSTSNTLKDVSKASSTLKGPQSVSKTDKPILSITTSTPPEKGKTSAGGLAGSLQDPNSPPPKKGSYRELMSRKLSDMVPAPPRPVYTGKQIKEAAKRNAKRKPVRHSSYYNYEVPRAPQTQSTDPNARTRSPEEKQRIAQARKRAALQRANSKFPRRAYNGTGATQAQASSQGTTARGDTATPMVRTSSSTSASSGHTSDHDMVAGYLDVEEEESRAARSAKKEDEEEARLEAELKKAKERRKMRLALESRGKK